MHINNMVVIVMVFSASVTDSAWEPSISAFPKFTPKTDVAVLRKAMKGFGTDEASIIKVIMARNLAQRKQLVTEFKNVYKRDLLKDLKSELGGNLEDLVVGLFQDRYDFVATELKNAIKGPGTNENTLNELLCCRTVTDMQMVKTAYKNRHNEALEKDVKSDTSGEYRKLMLALITKPRELSTGDDEAKSAVEKLIKAGLGKHGTDEDVFIQIFSQSSFPLLKKIETKYLHKTNRTLKDAVESETSGDFKKGLISVLDWSEDPVLFYSKRLHSALDKLFPETRAVSRIIILRAEIDLKAIDTAFLKRFNQRIKSLISDKTSGDFRKALITLLDGNA